MISSYYDVTSYMLFGSNPFGQAPTSCTTPVDLDGTTASWACAANASPAALLGDTASCAEHMYMYGTYVELEHI